MIWIVAGALLLLFAWISLSNWILLFRRSSWIPLIGGAAGVLGCLLAPDDVLRRVWWIPLIVDFGCLPGLAWTVIDRLFLRRN